ncbi:hypothetical protein ACQI5H_22880 [Mycobacterium heidelbergense]|uniref:hypothetical protein n=1 Tax=Mycobacterium heidelbergense TaxID=53376 RepID=UPI003CE67718
MEAAQAISLVSDFVRANGLDYPSEGLEAVRFEAGWRVYAPVGIDKSDPIAFLDMPVDQAVFLVGDSGRVHQTSTSIPPRQAHERFTAQEVAVERAQSASDDSEFMAGVTRQPSRLSADGPSRVSDLSVDARPEEDAGVQARIAAEASRLLDPIVQQLAQRGPRGWERFSAVFAFTVSAEVAQLRFWPDDQPGLVPVPESIAQLVRQQREVTAAMPAGPWWRLLLTVTNCGAMTVDYDYGDEPFPDDQLLTAEHYRNDLDAYRRPRVPIWLAGYVAGPVQGREPKRAAIEVAADRAAGTAATPAPDFPALPDLLARWAVLSATYVGAESHWGPRIFPGYAWYESDHRSGSTLYLLPGRRAILSGGKWNSPLLEAAYNGGQPLPDLYTGAPVWVNNTVLNTRYRNGLLSFCFWWDDCHWYRGATGTAGELDEPLPPVWSAEKTLQAMMSQTGPNTEDQCHSLLTAASGHAATNDDVAAIFTNHPGADVDAAVNQLSLAGLLAP